jgi:hypothetical protein
MATVYNANPNLKAIGVSVNFTPEQIQEYIKCKNDYIYFIETYCQIVTLDHGLQLFKLYDCQKEKLKIIHENRKVILMEGRQQGKTTTSAAYILWYTIFQDAKTVAILANKATAAREVLARYQIMYEGLPVWLQQGIKSWNKGDVELENGSKVFTAATSTSGIRGKSVNLLYVDEAAIIPNTVAEQFFTSVYPTISAGETTKILLSSTPLGYNHFWKFWNDAEHGRNGFVNCFIPYWKIPGRDEKWALEQKAILGDLKYNQEVLCKFLGSAMTLINSDVISMMSPIYPVYSKDGLDVFEEPVYEMESGKFDNFGKPIMKPPHTYVLIADVSAGVEGDYSAFSVIDITTAPYKQVAKFRKNDVSTLLYPNFIYKVAKEYNNAYILVEINISDQVANILHNDLEYDNLLFVNRNSQGQAVSGGFGGGRAQLGVVTDRKVKRIGCMNLKTMVEEQKLLIPDADTISEITTFIESKGSYAADDGYCDDLVMTLVLFGWLTTQPYFKDLNDINLRDLIYRSRIKAIENELTPFGFIADGQGSEERPLLNF